MLTLTPILIVASMGSLSQVVSAVKCRDGGGDKCAFEPINPVACAKDFSCHYLTICDAEYAGFDIDEDCCQNPPPGLGCSTLFDPQICGSKQCRYPNLCVAGIAGYTESQCDPEDLDCYPERPRPVRDGQRFRFNLNRIDADCVDEQNERFQYGQLERISGGNECAEACVNWTNTYLLSKLLGFQYNCSTGMCQCLYQKGALHQNRKTGGSDPFFKTNEDNKGEDEISDEVDGSGYSCYELVNSHLLGEASVSFVRGRK